MIITSFFWAGIWCTHSILAQVFFCSISFHGKFHMKRRLKLLIRNSYLMLFTLGKMYKHADDILIESNILSFICRLNSNTHRIWWQSRTYDDNYISQRYHLTLLFRVSSRSSFAGCFVDCQWCNSSLHTKYELDLNFCLFSHFHSTLTRYPIFTYFSIWSKIRRDSVAQKSSFLIKFESLLFWFEFNDWNAQNPFSQF